ncbi:MAG: PP2C family protein-serine/threonine phosphatase [Planctomycetota bacterium]|jgi:serine/threonine protein phosphatase PrpC
MAISISVATEFWGEYPIFGWIMITGIQSQILTEQLGGEVALWDSAHWRAAYASHRNPWKESPNEDAVAIFQCDETSGVFAVADGCGGMRGGETAARIALECLEEALANNTSARLRPAILDGMEQADEAIRNLRIGAACTLAIVEWQNGVVRPYHVGDAKIVIMGGMGRIRYQSICHSPVGFAVESGWLQEEDAMHHADRHLVSNVVGCSRMRIEIGPAIRLGMRDTVLIASDGLFDNVSIEEGVGLLRKGSLEESTTRLIQLVSERMSGDFEGACKPDDLSLIAMRPKSSAHVPLDAIRPR